MNEICIEDLDILTEVRKTLTRKLFWAEITFSNIILNIFQNGVCTMRVSVKLWSTSWSNTVKLNCDVFQWQPLPSSGQTTPRGL